MTSRVPPPQVRHRRRPAARTLLLPLAAATIALLLPLAVFLAGTWLTGRRLHLVESGSMEPAYPVGSVLVVHTVEPADVDLGTPIMFEDPNRPGRLVTHRVVEVLRSARGLHFRTQGDANDAPDASTVPARLVRGSVEWHVPALGRALELVRWPWGFVLLVVLPGLLLAAVELGPRRLRSESIRTGTS